MALPAWFAAMVHVPAPRIATVDPATEQIPPVREEKTTGLPEPPPVAEIAKGGSPKTRPDRAPKTMACAALATANDCVTRGAGP